MGNQHKGHPPEGGLDGVTGKVGKITLYIVGIALQVTGDRGKEILQAPTGYHGIEAEDNGGGEDAQIAYVLPRPSSRQLVIGTGSIGLCVASYDKLADHPWYAEQHDTSDINQDKGCPAVLTSHVGEPPYVAQAYCRPCRCQYDAYLATEVTTFLHLLMIN